MIVRYFIFVLLVYFIPGMVFAAAKDVDVLSDLTDEANLSSVAIIRQTNALYRVGWENPKETRRFAKIIFPLPRTQVALGVFRQNSRCHCIRERRVRRHPARGLISFAFAVDAVKRILLERRKKEI